MFWSWRTHGSGVSFFLVYRNIVEFEKYTFIMIFHVYYMYIYKINSHLGCSLILITATKGDCCGFLICLSAIVT